MSTAQLPGSRHPVPDLWYAHATRDGRLVFSRQETMADHLPLARGHGRPFLDRVKAAAELAPDREGYLVPGMGPGHAPAVNLSAALAFQDALAADLAATNQECGA